MATNPDEAKKVATIGGTMQKMTATALGTGATKTAGLSAPRTGMEPAKAPTMNNRSTPIPRSKPAVSAPSTTTTTTAAPAPAKPSTVGTRFNDSVVDRTNEIASSGSALMEQAAQSGARAAGRRGLLNSSIAVGASQGEVLKNAADIAKADAAIAGQKNLSEMESAAAMERLQTDAALQMERLQKQLASAEGIAKTEIQAQMDRLKYSTDAEMERVKTQGDIASKLQAQGNTEQIQRMGIELTNQLQVVNQQHSNALVQLAASGDQEMRRLVEASNQERERLRMSIEAGDRQAMASAMVNIFQVEQGLREALLSNPNIPASERASYERAITAMGDPIRKYMNQLFGTTAPTGTPTTGTPTTGGNTGVVHPTGRTGLMPR